MLSGSRCDDNRFGRPSTALQQARQLRLGDGVARRIHFDTVFLSSQGIDCQKGIQHSGEGMAARKILGDNMRSSTVAATVSAT